MIKRKKNKLLFSLFLIIFVFAFYFVNNNLLAQIPGGELDSQERDAIAVRILPNPNNYSIETWYQKQGFTGSPQSLVVDGYQAIRDGRTVYVNAANVVDNKLYTNIYLISHNQEPDIKTVDILGRIVDTWKFNKNLDDPGTCSIASQRCSSDADCAGDLVCRTENFEEEGTNMRCRISENINVNCLIDPQCPTGIYCDSLKAKVTRDVRRLANLTDIREGLEAYRFNNGNYPVLQSGSYIRHHTLSVWPSWQELFLPSINLRNKVDSINALGNCGENFDPVTCWNEENSQFYNFEGGTLILPADSHAFAYSSNANGSDYNLCAVLESYLVGIDNAEGNLSEQNCITSGTGFEGEIDPEEISIHSYNLTGMPNREFSGFIRISNPSGYPLNWSLDTGGGWGSWSDSPILQEINNPNERRVWAERSGGPGNYPISLNVSSEAGNINESFEIEIVDSVPFIEIPSSINYFLNPNKPLKFTAKASDDFGLSSLNVSTGLSGSANNTVQETGNSIIFNYEKYVTGNFPENQTVSGTVTAENNIGRTSSKNFNINLKVTPPVLDFVCPFEARVNRVYSCLLGSSKQGDFNITYQAENLPSNISLEEITPENLCGPEFEYNGKTYIPIYKDGLCWLDRNLGANRLCNSVNDSECFGHLFQWGRDYDGHQKRDSNTTSGLSNSDNPGHSNFITPSGDPFDWRNPQNNNLWQGVDGINNPCPSGWRIPTRNELNNERNSWTATGFDSKLRWSTSNYRDTNGQIESDSNNSIYWTSRTSSTNVQVLEWYGTGSSNMNNHERAKGAAVRCVKDVDDYWVIEGVALDFGKHEITIKAFNDYQTESSRNFNLNVNTFCGDGILQKPNTEGRGGFYNDGNEDCDGTAGTTNSPEDSYIGLQYGCNMGEEDETPYPILTGGKYCVFKSPLEGGGFCGDGLCQTNIENASNCPEDCGSLDIGVPGYGDNGDDEEESCQGQYFAGYCELKDGIDPNDHDSCLSATLGGSHGDGGNPNGCQSFAYAYCIRNSDREPSLPQYHDNDCVAGTDFSCDDYDTSSCDAENHPHGGLGEKACDPTYNDCSEITLQHNCESYSGCSWE